MQEKEQKQKQLQEYVQKQQKTQQEQQEQQQKQIFDETYSKLIQNQEQIKSTRRKITDNVLSLYYTIY